MVWYLSKHGMVHRDISDGNVYEYLGRGIVGDLEYMKRISEDGPSDIRAVSGMGCEIQTNGLIHSVFNRVRLATGLWKSRKESITSFPSLEVFQLNVQ